MNSKYKLIQKFCDIMNNIHYYDKYIQIMIQLFDGKYIKSDDDDILILYNNIYVEIFNENYYEIIDDKGNLLESDDEGTRIEIPPRLIIRPYTRPSKRSQHYDVVWLLSYISLEQFLYQNIDSTNIINLERQLFELL